MQDYSNCDKSRSRPGEQRNPSRITAYIFPDSEGAITLSLQVPEARDIHSYIHNAIMQCDWKRFYSFEASVYP